VTVDQRRPALVSIRRGARRLRRARSLDGRLATITLERPARIRASVQRCAAGRCRTIGRRGLDLSRGPHRISLRDLGRRRPLRPGLYRLRLASARLTFRIVR
jgi:hypothetical protein